MIHKILNYQKEILLKMIFTKVEDNYINRKIQFAIK